MESNNYNFHFLDEPIVITKQFWPKDTLPLVSTSTLAYNHSTYIRECIESILMQKTTFPVRIVIFDDCSTDGTREIIKEYEAKYPRLICGIYPKENTYQKPTRREALKPRNEVRNVAKYIALCEGDDYWTDPLKLQKQVDFMETNPECSLCFTGCEIHKANGEIKKYTYKFKGLIDADNYITKDYYMATASLMYKSEILDDRLHESWMSKAFAGDFILRYKALVVGKIGFIEDISVVYNKGTTGSWSTRRLTSELIEKEYKDNILGLEYLKNRVEISPLAYKIKLRKLENSKLYKEAGSKMGFKGLIHLIRNYNSGVTFYIGAYIKNYLLHSFLQRK